MKIPWIFAWSVCVIFSSAHADEKESISKFASIGERRLEIVGAKIEDMGCVLDKQAILAAKDGETLVLKHKSDPRGNAAVVFNHVILPKGQWVLYGAKNSLLGKASEEPSKGPSNKMEAVSAMLSGRGINTSPREAGFDDAEVYRMVYVRIDRISGGDIKLAHSLSKDSVTHGFGYTVPKKSRIEQRQFGAHQIPLINILHKNDEGVLLAGALCWFQQAGEKGDADQSATRPGSDSKGGDKSQPESESRSR